MSMITKLPAAQAENTRDLDLATFTARAAHEQRKQEPTQNKHGVRVGDLFYDSWGYEQTNIDFYEVIALKGTCTAVLRQIAGEYIGGFGWTGDTRPCRGQYTGEPAQVRTGITTWRSEPDPYCNCPGQKGRTLNLTSDDKKHGYSSYY